MPLSTDFLNNPQTFCQHHAIQMPGTTMEDATLPTIGRAHGAWTNEGNFYAVPTPLVGGAVVNCNMGYDKAAVAVNVCWIALPNNEIRLFVQGSADQTNWANAHPGAFNDWFQAYFLPWGGGKIARMVLPAQGPAVANPVRAFFTAEMNGCSFVVGGSKSSPVVAHYNVANPNNNLTQNQKDQEQNAMVKATLNPGGGVPNVANKRVAALRWVAPTYAGDNTTGAAIASNQVTPYEALGTEVNSLRNNIATQLAAANRKFDPNVANATGLMENIRVAMMGVLDPATRHWTFFYQRNFASRVDYKDKLGKRGGLIKFLGRDTRATQVQMRRDLIAGWEYTELWPNGPGVARMPAHGNPNI